MARSEIARPYNGGLWTAARMHAFIKGALRSASMRWPPKARVKKAAWIRRGEYQCAGYGKDPHSISATILQGGRRINNVLVDHIDPVVDPIRGFEGWDKLITRMFCEDSGLQVLCHECHSRKTQDEKERKKNEPH